MSRDVEFFEDGREPVESLSVDIASCDDDTVATLSAEHADKVVRERDRTINMLVALAQAFSKADPDTFEEVWNAHD